MCLGVYLYRVQKCRLVFKKLMRIAIYTDTISEHQMPVAWDLVKEFGENSVRYFYVKERALHRKMMMGSDAVKRPWTLKISENLDMFNDWAENAEILYTIFRLPSLMERRIQKRLITLYMSERWLKPPVGMLRLLHPAYFMMARRMLKCFESGLVTYLPTGIVAATDMLRIASIVKGRFIKAMFQKRPMFEHCVGGAIDDAPWMRMWGYFVKPGTEPRQRRPIHRPLKILWVGRYLRLKRVDTLIKAVLHLDDVTLDLYGTGEAEYSLRKLANGSKKIHFHSSIPLDEVRRQMLEHDVYVMPSNGFDGWGAVISEAIEEGMVVLGTSVVGASATILPCQNVFEVGDWRKLARILELVLRPESAVDAPKFVSIDGWSARDASKFMVEFIKNGTCA